jgi:hypothetical protein
MRPLLLTLPAPACLFSAFSLRITAVIPTVRMDRDVVFRWLQGCVLLLALLDPSQAARAQGQFTLLDYTNQWRYLQGNGTPANWQDSAFDDSTWPAGTGPFGTPANEPLPPSLPPINTVLTTNGPQGYIITYYSRTTLALPVGPSNVTVTASAAIDDGMVIYVNGREARRVGMATNQTVTWSTFANRGSEVGTQPLDTFTLASSNFVQGVNTIAVELHQSGLNSSDAVFALKLTAEQLQPVAITSHPVDQTIEDGFRATFSVAATGSALRYQWYSTNRLLTAATNSSYTAPTASPALNDTLYHVVVSNPLNSVTSSTARLTVIRDERGPLAQQAVVDSSNRVIVAFNERLLQSSVTNPANYTLSILGTTNQLRITNAIYGVAMLRVTADRVLNPNSNYVICMRDIMDAKTNLMSPNPTCLPVSFLTSSNLVSFGNTWRYNDIELSALPPEWITLDYDDDPNQRPYHWAEGQGAFAFSHSTGFNPCSPVRTALSLGPTTYYFRKRFYSAQTYPTNAMVALRHLVDDGAVFYLNGAEIHRVNLPSGPISYGTRAPAPIGDALCVSNTLFVAHQIVQGTNILAVEVHQAFDAAGTTDVAFDADFTVLFHRTPQLPQLQIAYTATNAILTWESDWVLESAQSISGLWSTVETLGNTYVTPLHDASRRFFRLARP